MVAGCISSDLTLSVSVHRLWVASSCDDHNLVPKILPDLFAGAQLVQGDGGEGSVKLFNFTPAVPESSHIKYEVQVLDHSSHTFKNTVIEGGLLGKRLRSQTFETKFEASGADSSVAKLKIEYDTLDDAPLTEDEQAHIKEGTTTVLKAIEGHLLANPTAYA